jgi:type III pantothenate kinase
MLLTIDIGNSQIAFGVFHNNTLQASWRLATSITKTSDEYGSLFLSLMREGGIQPQQIKGTIISSVVPPVTPIIEQVIEGYFNHCPILVHADFPFQLTIQYANPQEIGTDRLVNAAAAYEKFQTGLTIVDFGTATTFCTVTPDGRYVGGAIAPGLKSSAKALHAHTSKLPNVELIQPKSVIGTDTVSSIQSGLIYGYTGLVDELVTRIQQELGQSTRVIATGGLASVLAPISRTIQEVCPYLTLEGLHLLYHRVKSS